MAKTSLVVRPLPAHNLDSINLVPVRKPPCFVQALIQSAGEALVTN